jgi:hypothetical protein
MKTTLPERRARRRRLQTAILRDVRKGSYGTEAARRHGVSSGTFWQWQWIDPAFNAALKAARKERVHRLKMAVLGKLREGRLLKDTSKAIGPTPGTLRAWRKKDPPFGARVKSLLRGQRKLRNRRGRNRRP